MACHGNPETGGEPLKGLVLDWYAYNEKGEVVKKEGSDGSPVFQSVVPRRFGREPLARPSPQGIYTTIRYGIGGTPMTGFPQLSEETIWDLVSYISYLREKNYASP
jgi:cytochrome c1